MVESRGDGPAGRIAAAVEQLDETRLVAALADLVRIPSVYDPAKANGNERAAADFVAGLLSEWGIPYRQWEVARGRPNIVAELAGARPGPALIFEGHTDVVTAGDLDEWSVDPFGAEVRAGKLYGRGSADMKSGLAALLFAARAMQLAGADFAGSLRLAVLADEEGLMQGAKAFVHEGYLTGATGAIICEPEGGRVCVAQKGALRLRVHFHGKMAHGAMPEEGANPLAALGNALVACQELEARVQAEARPHPLLGMFYLTPTVVQAGALEQANVLPASAELLLDIRTTPAQPHGDILRRVESALVGATAGVPGVSCTVTVVDDRPATETDPDDPLVRATIAAHRAEFGSEPPLGGVPGSTDGTIFWAANRLPLVTYGPGDTTIPHQADEFVRLDEVTACARVYIGAALRYFDELERG